jgi:DNA polymerase I-like protein with 3'-5' exonuclease and polymerase domains
MAGGAGVFRRQDAFERLRKILGSAIDGTATIIGANTSYDARCTMRTFPELAPLWWQAYAAGRVEDVQIREKLLDIATGQHKFLKESRGYSLAALAKALLNVDLEKTTWRTSFDALDDLPLDKWPPGARDYATTDASILLPIWHSQEERAGRMGYALVDGHRQAQADLALQLASAWGIRTDPARVRVLNDNITKKLEELATKLRREGIMRPDGSKNMKAIRDRVAKTYPGGEPPRTDGGSAQTGADVLEECDDLVLGILATYNGLEKTGSTFGAKLFEGTVGPIHTGFDVLGADTGRISSFAPNLTNQPRAGGVRECFVPREGCAFVACDFDCQEMRTWAQACVDLIGWSTLAESFRKDPDFDPHTLFASNRLGITYEDGLKRKAVDEEILKTARQRAKAADFGFPGGMGAKKFRTYAKGYGVYLTDAEAAAVHAEFMQQYPEAPKFFDWVSAMVPDGGTVTARMVRSGRWRGNCRFTQLANIQFQGPAGDASKTALFEVSKRCHNEPASALYGSRPLLFVHDELVLEVPLARVHEVALELENVMARSQEVWTPNVPARASATAMLRWSKKAKRLKGPDGRLIPWDDGGPK